MSGEKITFEEAVKQVKALSVMRGKQFVPRPSDHRIGWLNFCAYRIGFGEVPIPEITRPTYMLTITRVDQDGSMMPMRPTLEEVQPIVKAMSEFPPTMTMPGGQLGFSIQFVWFDKI